MPRRVLGIARRIARTPLNILLNLADPPVIVLLYHRVTTLSSDPEMLAVAPENFRDQMRYLKENVALTRFDDDWSNAPKPAVAVTFDDGYADNALEALPILEETGVPATFFVTTGNIGSRREFWWNELERLILGDRRLPDRFSLDDMRSWPTGSDRERQDLYNYLVGIMNAAEPELRTAWLDRLRSWAYSGEADAGIHRSMTVDELRSLAASRWVTIGAHTVSHSRLASLPVSGQREEITASKTALESWLGRDITVFSYPFGRRCDYTPESAAICREAGFVKAAANYPGQTHRWTDPYQIPRHLVRNWPVGLFAEKLRGFWTR